MTKTTENPRTNSAVPATTRLFAGAGTAGATGRAATASPEPPDPSPASGPSGSVSPAAEAGRGPPVPAMPVTNERYPGTSGRQQGDRKVTAPAAAATGSARSSGPEVTSWPTPLTRAPVPGRQGCAAGGQSWTYYAMRL